MRLIILCFNHDKILIIVQTFNWLEENKTILNFLICFFNKTEIILNNDRFNDV